MLTRPSAAKQLASIDKQAQDVLLDYIAAVEIVRAAPLPQPVCRDPDDDAVLALAIAANADLIVSGDNDLLVLQQFEGVPSSLRRRRWHRWRRQAERRRNKGMTMGTDTGSHDDHAADGDMPGEIDFAHGTRGKFHRADAPLSLPAGPDAQTQTAAPPGGSVAADDPAFGMWRDREDMADVAAYIRRIRAPRFNRDGSRNKP